MPGDAKHRPAFFIYSHATIIPMRFFRKRRKKKRGQRAQNPRIVLIRQIVIGVLLFTFVGLIGTGIWYGSRVEALTLTEVEVIGGETIDHENVRTIAEEELTGAYYHLVPRRFAWTYPEETITERISAIERVKNVHIERTSGQKLVVVFEEHKPFALWCETLTTQECLFLDREGFAFGHAPKLQGSAFLRFSETDRVPQVGESPFTGAFVQESSAFIKRVYNELDLNIIQIEKTDDEELTYHIAGGGELKVSLRMDTDKTFENLETILFSEQFSHIAPGNFQYIDLRYGNKIFVNEEEPVTATSTPRVSTSTATSTE